MDKFNIINVSTAEINFFNNDDNYRYFLKKYIQYIYPVCQTFAYCLMPNHFHFLVRVRGEEVLFNQAQSAYN